MKVRKNVIKVYLTDKEKSKLEKKAKKSRKSISSFIRDELIEGGNI